MKYLNLGLMAHVDAGKTTLTEQMLLHAGAIRKAGSVDDGTAHTDFLEVERRRGISVRAAVTSFSYGNRAFNLIDTPGHVDFSGEVERVFPALDGAVVVLSAVEGVQAYTEQIFRALAAARLPALFFINKIDRAGADAAQVILEIRRRLTDHICVLNHPDDAGGICRAPLSEAVAELDEAFLDAYLEGNATEELAQEVLAGLSKKGAAYPVLCGSALHDVGVAELLDACAAYLPSAGGQEQSAPSGVVFKVEHHPSIGKIAYIRLFDGVLKNRDAVQLKGKKDPQKIVQIRKFSGEKYQDAGLLCAGDIGGVCGLSSAQAGDVIGQADIPRLRWSVPLMRVQVHPLEDGAYQKLFDALSILNEEDPLLDFYASAGGALSVSITGVIQTEVLQSMLESRFGISVQFGKPDVIYKETLVSSGTGRDRYTMPKPCWADLTFSMEPLPRGSGIEYSSVVPPKKLPYRYQRHVEVSVPRALQQGVYGFAVTDVKITLVDGEYHPQHTHPLDFFVCTPMAVANGLHTVGTKLLEPMLAFSVSAPEGDSGKIIGEIVNMRGSFDNPEIKNGRFLISGRVPVATSMEFPVRLSAMTGGEGVLSTRFDGYQDAPSDVKASVPLRGVDPLDRSKFILWARGALGQFEVFD